MTKAILTINNLTCKFGSFVAVNDVSFSLDKGEAFALLGESGCGKTTILRAIAGLETPVSGEIFTAEQCLFSKGINLPGNKRKMGFIFQDYAVFPHLSVKENILFAVNDKKEHQSALKKMLDLLHLNGQENKMPHQLSGGQLQRVAIARTLAAAPDIVLMDEPFSNLDAQLSRQLRSEIRDIFSSQGITSILVTHNQEEAFAYADRIAVMKSGKILQLDTPESIYTHPATEDVASFFGHCQFLEGEANGNTAQSSIGEVHLIKEFHSKVKLLLRPENIIIHPDAEGQFCIKHIRFLGDKKEITIKNHRTTFFVNAPVQSNFKIDDKIRVTLKSAVPAYEARG